MIIHVPIIRSSHIDALPVGECDVFVGSLMPTSSANIDFVCCATIMFAPGSRAIEVFRAMNIPHVLMERFYD